ncbi:MAG: nickel-responsive regulator [Candidatus Raymondbacteria bacterium RifOxyA12_full_50_37]|uniref:Putative nickel-responsive regulator n=1 Tax=Candidatus Raymondbacteria bacterium RIFOXYD12_FULL_49_13 TaxID=1817890 RepID=A0A1F7F2J0_UNCRA|nr:MAG: nickel-responsive regulator [Candidatus Raymondbacteria bacterium RifOxyA12_full_50_37]OGJ87853.1 MAG: nickel-responsive regulator [Candidatus Raymondbacteria bacterium RifOxyB12_full_50_8]OGJ88714.1 MAG: nickel-responsive regulator [Candidatus Raymondbacteria bacterium RIFOXYA2_FULL_49_16]OGK00884.1 MAG: nickel-responsive regulator [Candidatus Raymondbacteria bacterium RIFOXYD12_FULL_49_13]OGP41751.1 MAG: nickel-responsive regulator [Candidatus Raymondbacteria bacterium RIFOXYB2_FULL_4
MSSLYRFGISLEQDLIKDFDSHIRKQNYRNRSEAIRDLIREALVRKQWEGKDEVAGAITMSYDHHKRTLVNRLMEIQHDFQPSIISSQHVHLDHHNCLEIIAVKGRASEIQKLADALKANTGVKHVTLSMSTTGRILK